MTLFFDECFGTTLPRALRVLGLEVELYSDHLQQGASDPQVLALAGQHSWCLVTRDVRSMKYGQPQRQALRQHRVGCFMLSGSQGRRLWYAVRIIARHWDRMEEIWKHEPRPFLYRLRLHYSAKAEPLSPTPNDTAA